MKRFLGFLMASFFSLSILTAANCVILVDEDVKFKNVTWANASDLRTNKRHLSIFVQQVAPNGFTNTIVFGFGEILWLENTTEGLIVGEIIASPNSARKHFLSLDGTQDLNQTLRSDLHQAAIGGSDARFFTLPFNDPDYDRKVNVSLDCDFGTCPNSGDCNP